MQSVMENDISPRVLDRQVLDTEAELWVSNIEHLLEHRQLVRFRSRASPKFKRVKSINVFIRNILKAMFAFRSDDVVFYAQSAVTGINGGSLVAGDSFYKVQYNLDGDFDDLSDHNIAIKLDFVNNRLSDVTMVYGGDDFITGSPEWV